MKDVENNSSNQQSDIKKSDNSKVDDTVRVSTTTIISKPIKTVWAFCVENHVINHPKWDEDIKLEKIGSGPIRIGTKIRRTNTRYGKKVVGTQTVIGLEKYKSVTFEIVEGPSKSRGSMIFKAIDSNNTKLTSTFEAPGDSGMDKHKDLIDQMIARSGKNIKELLEE